jgi:hypothetical protein
MAGTRPNKMIRRLMDGMIDAVLEKVPEYPDLVFDQRVKELLRVHEEAIRRGYMKKGGH